MSRKKKSNPTKRNLYIDTAIGGAFLVALAPGITGLTVHEWLGLAFSGALLTHLLLHWKWVVSITKRLFSKMPVKTRFSYVLNAALLWAFAMIGFTGFMMGNNVGLGFDGDFFRELHEVFANFSILLVGGHLLLHWKWLLSAFQRYILGVKPGGRARKTTPLPLKA